MLGRTTEAAAVIRADSSKLGKDLSKSQKMFASSFKKIGSGISKALSGSVAALGFGGGAFAVGSLFKDFLDLQKRIDQVAIDSKTSAAVIQDSIKKIGDAEGLDRGTLLTGLEVLQSRTGDMKFTTAALDILAKTIKGTGSAAEDTGELLYVMRDALKITDAKDLEQGMSAFIEAGNAGAVPLREMARLLPKVIAGFGQFSSEGVQSAAEVSAALQVVRKDFGSGDEAATGLKSFAEQLLLKAKELRKLGVITTDTSGNLVDLFDILKQLESANLGQQDFAKLFGASAGPAARALVENQAKLLLLTNQARQSQSLLVAAKEKEGTIGFKLEQSQRRMQEAIYSSFTPERIEKFASAMEKVASATEFIADHIAAFALTIAGIKLAPLIAGIASLGAGAAGLAGVTGASILGAGAAAGAGAVGAAGAAGYGAGTILDKSLGLSNKISDFFAFSSEERKARESDKIMTAAEALQRAAERLQSPPPPVVVNTSENRVPINAMRRSPA